MKFVITDKKTKSRIESIISGFNEKSIDELYNEISGKDLFFCGPNGEEIKFSKEEFDFSFTE